MKILNTWDRKDWKDLSPSATAKIFRRRHLTTILLVSSTLLLNTVLPLVAIKIAGVAKEDYVKWGLHYMGVLVVFAAPYAIFRYRCPKCNAPPTSTQIGAQGLLLFPKKCANCGAPLLPTHRWATE